MIDQSDATAKAFLWSLATLEAIDLAPIYASLGLDSLKAKEMVKTMCVDAYTRLSKGNDLNYRHRLAMLTGDPHEIDVLIRVYNYNTIKSHI
jgi:hypothetical protein